MDRMGLARGLPFILSITALAAAAPAFAQTQLPGITVTSPSPIAPRPRPQSETVVDVAPTPTPRPAQGRPAQAPPAQAPASVAPPQPLALTPEPIQPGLVVVTDSFVPVTVVTDRELQAKTGPTISDTLAQKPGVAASTFAPGASRPIIRGLDNHRVRIQENGIGTGDVSALSEDHGIPIDPNSVDRIEIIRGPGVLRYGSQAIGGVVAIENNRIPMFVPPAGFTARINGGLSSADRGTDGSFAVTAGSGRFVVHADGFARETKDYSTPQGRQFNSFTQSEGFALGTSYVWSNGYIGVGGSRMTSLYGIPGAEAADARPRIDLEQTKIYSKGEWRIDAFGIEAMRFWLGTSRYAHNEIIEDAGVDIIGTRFTNREREARLEAQHKPIRTALGELRGAAGFHWGTKTTRGFGVDEPVDGILDPAARSRMLAGFLFEELQVTRKLRLQAAGRLETTQSSGTAVDDPVNPPALFERSFTAKSGSVGMLYELPFGVVARLTGQVTERAPDIAELYSKGLHEATTTFELGNPNLKIERAQTLELGFKKATGPFRFDVSAFRTQYRGFIFKNFTGVLCGDTLASCGVDPELDQIVYAQRDATFRGAELAAQLDIAPLWRGVWGIDGQYDVVRATFEDGTNVPRVTPQRVGLGVYYRDANWYARLGVLQALKQDRVAVIDAKDTPTSGYTLLNADLAYSFKLPSSAGVATNMTIGIKGENLLDEEVRNHVSVKKDEVLQPGRTVRVYGSIKFN